VLDNADENALERLRDEPCILVERTPTVRYATPLQVVRDPGALRRHLHTLPSELAGFHDLAENLRIADHPEAEHAIHVLDEIGRAASDEAASDEVFAAVEAAWRILESGLRGRPETWADEDLDDVEQLEERIRSELLGTRTWPDRRGVLQPPGTLYIDDRPALRRFIPDSGLELLVDRPRFGVEALAAAGLRFLSAALEQEIVRVPGAQESVELEALLRDREDALARIVSAETGTTDSLDELRRYEIFAADEIVVRRTITGDPPLELGEHPVAAHLDAAGNRLFVQHLQPPAWTELAVAITALLCGEHSSPSVGAAIEKVLTAATAHAAHSALDTLQIPRLAMDARVELGEDAEVDGLFDDEVDIADVETSDVEDEAVDEGDDDVELPEDERGAHEADADMTGDAADSADADRGADSVSAPERGNEGGAGEPSETAGRTAGSGAGLSRGGSGPDGGRSVSAGQTSRRERQPDERAETPWRVWVSGSRGRQQQERSESEATAALRAEVSRRGVERVLQYEKDHGRWALEMPPNNPGFDVESRREPGRPPTRLIEVKSLAGSWEAEWGNAANPPQLTSEQFRMSAEDGNHWLYVVEYALDDEEWAIYPIQAIGQRANRYLLDHGWKEAADRPAGPGVADTRPYEIEASPPPGLDDVIFGGAERDDGDIPFLKWDEVSRAGGGDLADAWDAWFTSPAGVEDGDFAVQQLEAAMGLTLPFGSVAVFRPIDGAVPEGAVVIARVGDDGAETFVIRRAHLVLDDDGNVDGLHLRVDVPGRGDEYEFHDADSLGRIRAIYVVHQEL
jgi:hypothetical protein